MVFVRNSEAVAAIGCIPGRSASSSEDYELRPYEVFTMQNTESVTWPKLNAVHDSPNDSESSTDEEESIQALDGSSRLSNVNAADDDKYVEHATGSQKCIVVSPGESHIPKIMDRTNHWEKCLQIPDNDPFVNHVATVGQFINLYKETNGPKQFEERRLISKQFTAYLATSCSPKMQRRINHWSSQGFIYCLGQVDLGKLQDAVAQRDAEYAVKGRRNFELSKAVVGDLDSIQRYIMVDCPAPDMVSQLTNLLTACKRLVDDNGERPHLLYDQNTCIEFHQLLVATLLAYGKALDALEAGKAGNQNVNVDLARRVWFCATMLWRIAYSGALHYHLHVLYSNSWLQTPINSQNQIEKYRQFTTFCHRDYLMPNANDEEGEEFGGLEEVLLREVAKIFRGWLRLLVSHWEALSILAKYAPRSKSSLRITLLAVKKPKHDTRSSKVDGWKSTIRTLIEQHRPVLTSGELINPDDVVEYLTKRISRALKATVHHSIYDKFSSENLLWQGNMHCEATLTSLVSCLDCIPTNYAFIRRAIKESNYNTIATSGRCCPTCWELLVFMRHPSTDFPVCGRHPTLSQVELPPWLSEEVMMLVLNRFNGILIEEITTMMVRRKRRRNPV